MPATFQDYYQTLAVGSTASAEEIKQAFRKLARIHHPDVARNKAAGETRFKEINEAYEVLSDPVKRRRYDELGPQWQEGARQESTAPGARGGAADGQGAPFHFTGTGFSDFFEQFFGGAGGFDQGPGASRGAGSRPVEERRGEDIEGEILVTLAEVMHGTTRAISLQTTDPRTGQAERHSFQVHIPPGATEGRRIRVPGKGGAGSGVAPAGDLYLRVRYAAHPDFDVRGADLYHDVDIAPWEAVLGATLQAPSFEGPIRIRIPPGTRQGALLRVKGHGLTKGPHSGRGDLYVVTRIQVPGSVGDEERALWETLGRGSRFLPRAVAPGIGPEMKA